MALAVAGASIFVLSVEMRDAPTNLPLWLVFAVAFVVLELGSVEINDRLRISASIVVATTAAVVFGAEAALVAVVSMAALTLVDVRELREGRFLTLLANTGQLIISLAAAIVVFEPFLPTPGEPLSVGKVVAGTIAATLVYDWLNFQIVSAMVRRLYRTKGLQPWSHLWVNHISLVALGILGGLLGTAYLVVGPVALPLIVVVFAVGHIAFASYGRLREAQEGTVQGFVKAIEALDPYTRGHTDRVARFADYIAEELSFTPERRREIRWAALVHDVGKMAIPADVLRSSRPLTDEEYLDIQRRMHAVQDVLAEVDFLRPMIQIASGYHPKVDSTMDLALHHTHSDEPSIESVILTVADAFDAMTSARSYRTAVTQRDALSELRSIVGTHAVEVVDALERALYKKGEVYGLPDRDTAQRYEETIRMRSLRD